MLGEVRCWLAGASGVGEGRRWLFDRFDLRVKCLTLGVLYGVFLGGLLFNWAKVIKGVGWGVLYGLDQAWFWVDLISKGPVWCSNITRTNFVIFLFSRD